MRLTMGERQSLVRVNAPSYQKSNKSEKRKILDQFVESTSVCKGVAVKSRQPVFGAKPPIAAQVAHQSARRWSYMV
jgi:hypothetical protein